MGRSSFVNSVEPLGEASDQKLPKKDFVQHGTVGTQKFLPGQGGADPEAIYNPTFISRTML